MKRGFKSRCEEMAIGVRARLGLGPREKLCPFEYAKNLEIPVLSPKDLDIPHEHERQLTVVDPGSWSGLTMSANGNNIIVLNSAHARTRQVSTLMHELSHIVLKHVPGRIDVSDKGLLLLAEYDEEQEDEADWLAGAMLLPRGALLYARRRNQSVDEIASEYGVSIDLCNWRLRMTGIDRQLSARRSA